MIMMTWNHGKERERNPSAKLWSATNRTSSGKMIMMIMISFCDYYMMVIKVTWNPSRPSKIFDAQLVPLATQTDTMIRI